jgi:hypothetical protein
LLLDALLTGASDSFFKLASTPRASCTKQLLRVCLRPFRDGDCEGFPSRPRKSSRSFRRRFKRSARPRWRSWARGDSSPTGANGGDASPVGAVSTFRSADGQPAVRKATSIIKFIRPGHRALVQSNGRGRDLRRRRASRDRSPTSCDVFQHAKNARPLVPQFGAALSARAGLGSTHWRPPCSYGPDQSVSGFSDFVAGERPITIRPGEAESALQACTRQGITRPTAYRCTCSGGTQNLRSFLFPGTPELMPPKRTGLPWHDVVVSLQTSWPGPA